MSAFKRSIWDVMLCHGAASDPKIIVWIKKIGLAVVAGATKPHQLLRIMVSLLMSLQAVVMLEALLQQVHLHVVSDWCWCA